MTRRRLAPFVAAVFALFGALAANAHTRSTSWSSWEIEGREARVRFRIPQLELTRLPWGIVAPPQLAPELGRYLSEGLRLEAKDSAAHAREVRPGEIADRRRGIQERGRSQTG